MRHQTRADYNTAEITTEQWNEGRSIANAIQGTLEDRRLYTLDLYDQGIRVADIAQAIGVSPAWVYDLVRRYRNIRRHTHTQ